MSSRFNRLSFFGRAFVAAMVGSMPPDMGCDRAEMTPSLGGPLQPDAKKASGNEADEDETTVSSPDLPGFGEAPPDDGSVPQPEAMDDSDVAPDLPGWNNRIRDDSEWDPGFPPLHGEDVDKDDLSERPE